ncbi:hypothetical protein LFADAHJC_LOCUS2462 [Methylorubrum extorquens]
MTSPRLDQITELTRGVELPLVAVAHEHMLLIVEFLTAAWSALASSQPQTLATGSEAEVTALVEAQLNHLLDEEVDPIWCQMIRCVGRGKESLSFDGSHMEKRPDLSLYITSRVRSFPLIVECKIIDIKSKKGKELYCKYGIRRFVVGEYAWGVREAFMIGYVRDGSKIQGTLTPYLSQSHLSLPTAYCTVSGPTPLPNLLVDAARSTHGRHFSYSNASGPISYPGNIELWHLWMEP